MRSLLDHSRSKLRRALSVKIAGLGGIGVLCAENTTRYLAFAATETVKIGLFDGDQFESKNASRMAFSEAGNKAVVKKHELAARYQHSRLFLYAVPEYLTPANIARLVLDGDLLLCCFDNHKSRKLVTDHAATLRNCVVISGGNDGVGDDDGAGRKTTGTYGNILVQIRKNGRDITPPFTRLHPEIAHPQDRAPQDLSCTAALDSSPQLLFTNLAVASAMCNAFWLYLAGNLTYFEQSLDIAHGLARPTLPIPKSCP